MTRTAQRVGKEKQSHCQSTSAHTVYVCTLSDLETPLPQMINVEDQFGQQLNCLEDGVNTENILKEFNSVGSI